MTDDSAPLAPGLYLVATPIGNLRDITYRAVDVLGAVPVLACEDTRVTLRLYQRFGLPRPGTVFACHEHNETRATERVLSHLETGAAVAYCSDAGTPGISDPGFRLVRAVLAAGHRVEALPGACAATNALVMSGLPASSFVFLGFPPRKTGARQRVCARVAALPETLVFYESPHRVGAFLADAAAVLGPREAAVGMELTKRFERMDRDLLPALAERYAGVTVKGEVTVVIAGANPKFHGGTEEES